MISSKCSLQWVLLPDPNMRSSPIPRMCDSRIQSNTLSYFVVIYFKASLLRILNKLDWNNIIRPCWSCWYKVKGMSCRLYHQRLIIMQSLRQKPMRLVCALHDWSPKSLKLPPGVFFQLPLECSSLRWPSRVTILTFFGKKRVGVNCKIAELIRNEPNTLNPHIYKF